MSKFRTGISNRLITEDLFWEWTTDRNDPICMFTLMPYERTKEDGTKVPSLHKLYMEMMDSSEYAFANKYFESWSHWKKIATNNKIAPFVEKWREELEFKIRKEAFDRIKEAAENGSLEANKFIVNANFIDGIPEKVLKNGKLTNARPVGRPSNKNNEASPEELQDKLEKEKVSQDLKRLNMN